MKDDFLRGNPKHMSAALRALWHDGHEDWEQAHEAAQEDEHDPQSAWVHAYLHRKEGDRFNANYWYRRAAKPVFEGSPEDEWISIVHALDVQETTG